MFMAADVVPQKLLSGPNHQVDQKVENDGYMNHYTINSRFGVLSAQSNAELAIRVNELNAVAAMESVKGTDEYMSALAKTGGDVVTGAKNLITDPVNTVSGTISGVGRLFQRAGDSLSGGPKSAQEGNALENLTGISQAKRDYAAEFGVDVYSSNKVLQKRLDELASAGGLGGLTASAALMLVPGGAGVAVSVSKNTNMLNETLRTSPPVDLRRMNGEKLQAMGVHQDIIDLFIDNTVFSPTHQTLLVAALDEMRSTAARGQFVKFAISTDTEDLALFRQRQAQMYAAYNRGVKPIAKFVPVGKLSAAQTSDGALVFNVPLDHLAWTANMARVIDAANQQVDGLPGITGKQLWISGTMSALASNSLQERGWQVHESATNLLPAW